jgi:phosphoglycerate dehydrogenase-like enzyme
MKLKVHLMRQPSDELIGPLERMLSEDITLTCSEDLPDPPDYDILICGVPDRDAIEASPNLRCLIIPWSGPPAKTRDIMKQFPGIAVHNIHHNALPAAEMAITLMLAAAKDVISIDHALRAGDWSKRYNPASSLIVTGRRALIVGYGAIGKEIAVRCLGLGMTVSALAAGKQNEADRQVRIYPPDRLQSLLPLADVLFLSLPLTDETRGLIGESELSLLPDGAIVVNVSRGSIIDEEALYRHLKTGRLRAGLDVWYEYPKTSEARTGTPPSRLPFHDLSNVVMTPHLAGHSDQTEVFRARELARLLNLAAEGKPLPNRVDLTRGY